MTAVAMDVVAEPMDGVDGGMSGIRPEGAVRGVTWAKLAGWSGSVAGQRPVRRLLTRPSEDLRPRLKATLCANSSSETLLRSGRCLTRRIAGPLAWIWRLSTTRVA